jgi:hypothetical protein
MEKIFKNFELKFHLKIHFHCKFLKIHRSFLKKTKSILKYHWHIVGRWRWRWIFIFKTSSLSSSSSSCTCIIMMLLTSVDIVFCNSKVIPVTYKYHMAFLWRWAPGWIFNQYYHMCICGIQLSNADVIIFRKYMFDQYNVIFSFY